MHERVVQGFRRHELRRQGGSPTVSLLLGDPSHALRALTALQAREALAVFESRAEDAAQLASGWLRRAETTCDLYACAFSVLAHALDTPAEALRSEWSARSAAARRSWVLHALELRQPRHVRAALRWLSLSLPTPTSASLAHDPLHELKLVCAWLPRRLWPVPCLAPDSARGLGAWLELSEQLPSLSLIAVIDGACWSLIGDELGREKLQRALSGRIAVGGTAEETSEDAAQKAELAAFCGRHADLSISHARALRASEAERLAQPAASSELGARACDGAARLLYGLLQADPRTQGRFSANWSSTSDAAVPAVGAELSSESLRVLVRIERNQYGRLDPLQRQVRQRERVLQLRGYETVRVSARDVVQRGLALTDELAQLTAARLD